MKKAVIAVLIFIMFAVLFSAVQLGSSQPYHTIDEYLINQPYWAPQVGKPWIKLNYPVNDTNPVVPVTAYVRRTDVVLGSVLAYVTLTGTTILEHIEEFDYTTTLLDAGDDLGVGPVHVAHMAPAVGTYNCSINPYVLSDNAINILVGGAEKYNLGYFRMIGFCDINGDNVVDGKDFVLVRKAFQSFPGGAKWNFMADVDNSNSCTAADYMLVKTSIPIVYTPA